MEIKRRFAGPGVIERFWLWLEKVLNDVTTSPYNPFYYLGAICIFFLWIIVVTGIYLFIFYSISASDAFASVESITVRQWYLGGVMRSVHRYASDGLVIAMILHTLRCYVLDRYRHWRVIAWVSGVIIAWVIIAGGIFGYWMVWDERAKFVALMSSRMIESVPIFGLPLSLNFARVENLTNQLFYIILFIHFSSIVVIFILIMIHISRITKSVINPPKAVSYGIILVMLAVSFIKPAVSAPAANLKALPQAVPFDWFYMFVFPLLKYASAHEVWLFIVFATIAVSVVPWLSMRGRRKPTAVVTLPNCVGCELCEADCPYQAIQMRKRTDGASYDLEAVVLANRCASCGICTGSCDYNAINMPDITETSVKEEITKFSLELKAAQAGKSVIVFSCAKGAWHDPKIEGGNIKGDYGWARAVDLPCIGMLQPSMLSIPFEHGVGGVFVASCRPGDCSFRFGNMWFAARLSGLRPPVVGKSVDRSRIKAVYLSAVERNAFLEALSQFQRGLK